MTAAEPARIKKKIRRDSDPVRVFADGRIAYYPSGVVGSGDRQWFRCGSVAVADERAAQLRFDLAALAHLGPRERGSFFNLMTAMLRHHEAVKIPQGSIKQYRSNWNTWVPESVREAPCHTLDVEHWTLIFDGLTAAHASPGTILAVARTLGAVVKFGLLRGYFVGREPFGLAAGRREIVRQAVKDAVRYGRNPALQERGADAVRLEECPTLEEVQQYAKAFEKLYPGYGARLVETTFASGCRIGEVAALHSSDVDLEECSLQIDWQLDRYADWPALVAPKGGPRSAIFWSAFRPVLASLVDDAEHREGPAHGWLFPPLQGSDRWLDKLGRLAGAASELCEWPWTFHWLRHAWASISMAPEAVGGYGMDPKSVSSWLGHKRLSTTLDMYVVRQSNDTQTARELTARPPARFQPRRKAADGTETAS